MLPKLFAAVEYGLENVVTNALVNSIAANAEIAAGASTRDSGFWLEGLEESHVD